jgi:SAM-dependent methyltransferase
MAGRVSPDRVRARAKPDRSIAAGPAMRFLNPDVLREIRAGRGLRLDLGSGDRPHAGFYSLDRLALPGIDIQADLNEPFAELPDDSVAEIFSRHALEHVTRLPELIAEIHRVTRPGGRIEIIVPHFSNPYGYSDPTHVRFFGLYSFFYFCDPQDQPRRKVPAFYAAERFQVESVKFRLMRQSVGEKVVRAVLEPLINCRLAALDWYERRLCRFLPANQIQFVLRPKKRLQ